MDPQFPPQRKRTRLIGCALITLLPALLFCSALGAALGLVSLPSHAITLGSTNGLQLSIDQIPRIVATNPQSTTINWGNSTDYDYQTGLTTECNYNHFNVGRLIATLENCSTYIGTPGVVQFGDISPLPSSTP